MEDCFGEKELTPNSAMRSPSGRILCPLPIKSIQGNYCSEEIAIWLQLLNDMTYSATGDPVTLVRFDRNKRNRYYLLFILL